MRRIPHCSACSVQILWCRTALGKWMPVDRAPDFDDGNCDVDFTHDPPRVTVFGSPQLARISRGPNVLLRTSHYATCPAAGTFRRPAAPAPAPAVEPQAAPYEQGVLL